MTWQDHAACRGSDVDFFPVLETRRGYNFAYQPELVAAYEAKIAAAVAVCASCPVRAECAAFSHNERDGIWAGELRESHRDKRNRSRITAERERRLRERESA